MARKHISTWILRVQAVFLYKNVSIIPAWFAPVRLAVHKRQESQCQFIGVCLYVCSRDIMCVCIYK